MSNNINCAAMGYDCVFSVTTEDNQDDFLLNVVKDHAAESHSELVDDRELRPEVKSKLLELLKQSKFDNEIYRA